jgi:hypothetical protein
VQNAARIADFDVPAELGRAAGQEVIEDALLGPRHPQARHHAIGVDQAADDIGHLKGRLVHGRRSTQIVESLQRTLHRRDTFATDMRIDGGAVDPCMPEEGLHSTKVGACFQVMRGEAMAKCVWSERLTHNRSAFRNEVSHRISGHVTTGNDTGKEPVLRAATLVVAP